MCLLSQKSVSSEVSIPQCAVKHVLLTSEGFYASRRCSAGIGEVPGVVAVRGIFGFTAQIDAVERMRNRSDIDQIGVTVEESKGKIAVGAISDRTEGTFGRLRYSLGGDRPSQTAHLTLSSGIHYH